MLSLLVTCRAQKGSNVFLGFRNETGGFFVSFFFPLWHEMFTCLLPTVKKGGRSVEGVRRKWRIFQPPRRNQSVNAELPWDADFCARGCGASCQVQRRCVISGGFLSLSGPPCPHLMKPEIGAVPTHLSNESYYGKCLQPGHRVVRSGSCPCAPPQRAGPPPPFPGLIFGFSAAAGCTPATRTSSCSSSCCSLRAFALAVPSATTLPLVSPSRLHSDVALSVRPLSLLNSTFSTTLSPFLCFIFLHSITP